MSGAETRFGVRVSGQTDRWRLATGLLAVLCPLLLLVNGSGCEAPAAVAYVLVGKDKVPAVYELDRSRKTLILIEDDEKFFTDPNAGRLIAAVAQDNLEQEAGMKGKVIDQHAVVALRRKVGEARWRAMGLAQIGRMLGAEQVVYGRVEAMGFGTAGTSYRPVAKLEVKVIDAANGKTLFPTEKPMAGQFINTEEDTRTHTLDVKMQVQQPVVVTSNTMLGLERSLSAEVGVNLAKLFYAWRPPDAGDSF